MESKKLSNILIFVALVILGLIIPPPFSVAARIIVVVTLAAWRISAGLLAAVIYVLCALPAQG